LNNTRAIHRNPDLYPRPYDFNPDRYISYNLPAASYINITNPNDRDHMSYGAGRRVCPGIHVAERSMFMNIARILWCFDIGKKVVDGETVEPESRTCPGWMTVPRPFQCSIRVRSDRHAEIMRKTFEAADKDI
jgi:cytochrome P450